MLKHKHIRETVRTFGLELVDLSPCDGSVFKATVKAGDGTTNIIKINRDDGDKDRLTAQYLRRFANEHGRVTSAGKPAIPTVLQTAMAEAAQAASQAMKTAQERIESNPQPKDTTMATLQLTRAPTFNVPSERSAAEPEKKMRTAITHVQFARLANTIAAMDTSDYDSIPSLAAHLTVELGFPVTASPVRDALDMHGKTTKVQAQRIAAKLKPKGKQAALAAAIAHLYTKLGEELPADLKEML